MTSALEQIDATTVKLTISLTSEDIAPAVAHAFEHIGAQIQIPGFRKGKVPAKIIEARVGRDAVLDHAINDGLSGWLSDAIQEHKLRPYGQPEVDLVRRPGQVEGDEGLEFTAVLEVRPEIELPDLGTFKLEVEPTAVSEEDIEERLTALRERFATLVPVDRPAQDGDFVTLDLAASIADKEVDAVQGTSYQVGKGNMLDGLDEVLVGLSAGEETTYEGPLAAGEHAGETALIRVKVTAVKTRELPEADDEFAELASEFDTIAELREDLATQAERIKLNNQVMAARAQLLEKLEEAVAFELPRKVIENEVENHLAGENRLDDDEHRAEVTAEAEKNLRTQILLDQLADDLDIKVAEAELLDYLLSASRQYGLAPNEFIERIQQQGQIPTIVAEVARAKATNFALRRVAVVDTAGKAVDLSPVIGSLADETEEASTEGVAADADA